MEELSCFAPNSYGAIAEEDMVNAQAVASNKMGTPRAGTFWCEQAIEKYFKHLLVQKGNISELRNRHKLLPLAADAGFACSPRERIILRELGTMYYERYPVDEGEELPEDPTWEDVDEILTLALKVRSWTIAAVNKRAQAIKTGLHKMNLT